MKKNKFFLIFSVVYIIVAVVIIAALIGNKIPIATLYERTFFVFMVFEILLLGSVANYVAYLTNCFCNRKRIPYNKK
ncbi:hypothetical protein NDGK_00676 [Clostridiales bacterium CHKCI001]|nr:hypothetical protein NDGK_00676 [Clostridiales bacterium CHKCI001]